MNERCHHQSRRWRRAGRSKSTEKAAPFASRVRCGLRAMFAPAKVLSLRRASSGVRSKLSPTDTRNQPAKSDYAGPIADWIGNGLGAPGRAILKPAMPGGDKAAAGGPG